MNLNSDGVFIGVNTGQGQRGAYYNISVMSDGEPYRLNATAEAYNIAKDFEFGTECRFTIAARLYDRSWILRIVDINYLES